MRVENDQGHSSSLQVSRYNRMGQLRSNPKQILFSGSKIANLSTAQSNWRDKDETFMKFVKLAMNPDTALAVKVGKKMQQQEESCINISGSSQEIINSIPIEIRQSLSKFKTNINWKKIECKINHSEIYKRVPRNHVKDSFSDNEINSIDKKAMVEKMKHLRKLQHSGLPRQPNTQTTAEPHVPAHSGSLV